MRTICNWRLRQHLFDIGCVNLTEIAGFVLFVGCSFRLQPLTVATAIQSRPPLPLNENRPRAGCSVPPSTHPMSACPRIAVVKVVEFQTEATHPLQTVSRRRCEMCRAWACAVLLILGGFVISSSAQEGASVMALPDAIAWGPASPKLPPGAEIAVLFGDMSIPGELYAFRAKLPDGYSVAPHTHPMDEHVTVIEGVMTLGFGTSRDETKMRELPSGSYVTLPEGVPHYNRMKGETILQFHGIGPYDIIYVNPADDPSRSGQSVGSPVPAEGYRPFP